MYRAYLKMAVRSFLRNRLISLINISGLSIAMTVSLLLFLWVSDELSYNDGFAGHNQIARVIQNVTKNGEVVTWRHVPVPLADELRMNYGGDFEAIAHVSGPQAELLSVGSNVLSKYGRYAEPDFFKVFSIKLIRGHEGDLTGTSSIFLSESVAAAFFGDTDPLGKTISVNGNNEEPIELSVAGVYEDFAAQSELGGADYIAPWDIYLSKGGLQDMDEPWKYNIVELYVKINGSTSFASAAGKIKNARLQKVSTEVAKMKPELFLFPMNDWHLRADFKNGINAGGRIQYVWLFTAIGLFILAMACINFVNLTTAKTQRRAKEVGVRKSIGSARRQLVALFLTESVLITIVSCGIALTLTRLALSAFNVLAGKHVTIPWSEPYFLMLIIGACVLIALMCGLYPAVHLSSVSAIQALKGTLRSGCSSAMLRRGLVVLQFTISVVLIVVAVTVSRQIRFAIDRSSGYDRDALITVPAISDAIHEHFDAFKDRLIKSGIVSEVAEAWAPPTVRYWITTSINWPGKDPDLVSGFAAFDVSAEYGKTVGWKIELGRDFRKDSAIDTASIIVNEAAVKYMGFNNPVGQAIEWQGARYKIIGVAKNIIHESPYQLVQPAVYRMLTAAGKFLVIRTMPDAEAPVVIDLVEKAFKEFDPGEPFSYQFVSDEYAAKFSDEERVKSLTQVLSILAIMIGCLGLLGLVSYVAEQRTREIGVRKVLGASITNILFMLSKEFVLLVIISGLVAIPFGYYATKSWLEHFDYRIPFTWMIFVEAIASVLVITLATVSYQTIAAARRNPVTSLRSE